jgi:hypothetical protein
MKTSSTGRRGRQRQGDPLALVKADELRNLIIDLDEVHASLMGAALKGDNDCFALAQAVKAAGDYLAELQFAR